MRRLWLLLGLLILAGCGGGPEGKLYGKWKVDPASVKTTRLAPGAETKPDWMSAKDTLGTVEVSFLRDPKQVTVFGFGMDSTGEWKLEGNRIVVKGRGDALWPDMTLDPVTSRVHAVLSVGNDKLEMDLIKK